MDNSHANKLTVHILAAVPQHEREMIWEFNQGPALILRERAHVIPIREPPRATIPCGSRAGSLLMAQGAPENQRGLFRPPWRRPVTSTQTACAAPSKEAAPETALPPGCDIKGTISPKGDGGQRLPLACGKIE